MRKECLDFTDVQHQHSPKYKAVISAPDTVDPKRLLFELVFIVGFMPSNGAR